MTVDLLACTLFFDGDFVLLLKKITAQLNLKKKRKCYCFNFATYRCPSFSASSAALRDISSALRASPEAADTFLAINSTASGSNDTESATLIIYNK